MCDVLEAEPVTMAGRLQPWSTIDENGRLRRPARRAVWPDVAAGFPDNGC
jgi:hypothetical protein